MDIDSLYLSRTRIDVIAQHWQVIKLKAVLIVNYPETGM